MAAAFEAEHRRTYSFLMDRPLVVEAVSVEATGLHRAARPVRHRRERPDGARQTRPPETVRLYTGGAWRRRAAATERERMRPGDT